MCKNQIVQIVIVSVSYYRNNSLLPNKQKLWQKQTIIIMKITKT